MQTLGFRIAADIPIDLLPDGVRLRPELMVSDYRE